MTSKHHLFRRLGLAGVVAAAAFGATVLTGGAAHAQDAHFDQLDSNAAAFRFINNGSNSVFGTYTGAGATTYAPMTFQYDNVSYSANVSFTSKVDGTASVFDEYTAVQNLKDVNISFIEVGGAHSGRNLLTLSNATAYLLSDGAGLSFSLGSDTTAGDAGTYTSDLFTVGSNPAIDWTFLKPSAIGVADNGYLKSFTANGNGTFHADPVPEFGTMASLGGMVFTSGAFAVRRRRSKRTTAGATLQTSAS